MRCALCLIMTMLLAFHCRRLPATTPLDLGEAGLGRSSGFVMAVVGAVVILALYRAVILGRSRF